MNISISADEEVATADAEGRTALRRKHVREGPSDLWTDNEALSSEREALLRGILAVMALAAVDKELRDRRNARRSVIHQ